MRAVWRQCVECHGYSMRALSWFCGQNSTSSRYYWYRVDWVYLYALVSTTHVHSADTTTKSTRVVGWVVFVRFWELSYYDSHNHIVSDWLHRQHELMRHRSQESGYGSSKSLTTEKSARFSRIFVESIPEEEWTIYLHGLCGKKKRLPPAICRFQKLRRWTSSLPWALKN